MAGNSLPKYKHLPWDVTSVINEPDVKSICFDYRFISWRTAIFLLQVTKEIKSMLRCVLILLFFLSPLLSPVLVSPLTTLLPFFPSYCHGPLRILCPMICCLLLLLLPFSAHLYSFPPLLPHESVCAGFCSNCILYICLICSPLFTKWSPSNLGLQHPPLLIILSFFCAPFFLISFPKHNTYPNPLASLPLVTFFPLEKTHKATTYMQQGVGGLWFWISIIWNYW